MNKKEKKGEKNLLKKKLIFLSIDFDSFFLSRMDICLSMFMTRKEKLYEKMDKEEWKKKNCEYLLFFFLVFMRE